MEDPQIKKLVTTFEADIKQLNKTWSALQKKDVYVRMEILGEYGQTEPKWLEAKSITQEVSYKKSIKA